MKGISRAAVLILKAPVRFYRAVISPLLGPSCRFHPTCSAYALEALERHGPLKGMVLALRRILKCHPWCHCNWDDPVPKRFTWGDIFGYKRRQTPHKCDRKVR
ncbi:MAG: membrane protein insertion efficiency factor YidD [Rhodospirillales bacterium]|nr:membrane protein insertion efficiency factor YidD [Rhodospirillales bacterium]MCB9997276.1 membrane protein insertion efficiency factor YidD [Rhodospirillales bacterium]